MPDEAVKRLLAAIYPTRVEKALGWLTGFFYEMAEKSHWGFVWLGDTTDRLVVNLQERRVEQGRYLQHFVWRRKNV